MDMENIYKSVLDRAGSGIYIVKPDRQIIYWNDQAEKITGYKSDEIVGKHCPETLLNHIDSTGRPLCELNCPLIEAVVTGQERIERVTVRRKDGVRVPIRTRFIPIRENGRVVAIAESFEQIPGQVYDDKAVTLLSYELMHDKRMHLPNREYIRNYLKYKLSEYFLFNHPVAVMMAEVRLREGYAPYVQEEYCDSLLTVLGNAVRDGLKKGELVGALKNDRFLGVFLFSELKDIAVIGQRFFDMVKNVDFSWNGRKLPLTSAIGITAAQPNDNIDTIVLRAEGMMKKAVARPEKGVLADLQ